MSKVKMGLNEKTKGQIIVFGHGVVTAMTGNATYATPDPPLASITTAANNAQTALDAAAAAKSLWLTKEQTCDDVFKILTDTLTLEASYVQLKSGGDESKILSSGMQVQAGPNSKPLPAKVDSVHASVGDDAGEIDVAWHSLRSMADNYTVRYTLGDINTPTWVIVSTIPTKSKITIEGLPSLQKCWIEVAANNSAGRGGWSDPAYITIP